MFKTKDEVMSLDKSQQEIDVLRKKLYKMISIKDSYCDKEIVEISEQLDKLIIAQMKDQLLQKAI